MLSFHSSAAKGEMPVATDAKTLPPEVNWIDAVRPDAREIAFLERVARNRGADASRHSLKSNPRAGCAPRKTGSISASP